MKSTWPRLIAASLALLFTAGLAACGQADENGADLGDGSEQGVDEGGGQEITAP